MRLIDADKLIEEMMAGCMPINEKGITGILGDKSCIKDYIDTAPTIDASNARYRMGNPRHTQDILDTNQDDYQRIAKTAIHIVPSDNPQYKYMAQAYDYKTYSWRNADIYADDKEQITLIAKIVYGDDNTRTDNDLNITIDYGTEPNTSDTDLIY